MSQTLEFLVRHGYWILFAMVLAEQLGAPIPAIPVLLAMGALVEVPCGRCRRQRGLDVRFYGARLHFSRATRGSRRAGASARRVVHGIGRRACGALGRVQVLAAAAIHEKVAGGARDAGGTEGTAGRSRRPGFAQY